MSTLQDRLERIKEGFLKKAPEEAAAAVARSNAEIRESGLLSGMPAVGDPLPAFELEGHDGKPVRSDELLGKPFVLTFYRGLW